MKPQQQKEIKKKQQSDISRHVGIAGKKQETPNSSTLFTFCKNLLRNVALFAQRNLITLAEFNTIHTQLLLDAVHKYTVDQQKELHDLVTKAQADITASQENSGNAGGESGRNDLINYFESAQKQKVINESQLTFLKNLIMNPNASDDKEAVEPDAAMEEMKAVQAIYSPNDFKYDAAEFEERASDISHKCTVICRPTTRNDKDAPWLQVMFQFGITYPSTAPRISFVDSDKCTVAELAVLESLMKREATVYASQNKISVVPLVSYASKYLDSVAAAKNLSEKEAKAGELPYIPSGYKLTSLSQQTQNMQFTNMTLEELDKVLVAAVNDAVAKLNKETKKDYQITQIENVISPATFKQFKAKIIEFNTTHPGLAYMPIITFHGTCSPASASSISRTGLVSAGNYTSEGLYIDVSHGAVLGCGIYSTPDYKLASTYAYSDRLGNKQVFASLTLLGTPYFIESIDEIFDKYIINSLFPVTGHDSHIWRANGMEQFVVFDASQILPVLLVTTSPQGTPTLEKRLEVKLDVSGPPSVKEKSAMAKWKQLAQAQEDLQNGKKKRPRADDELVMYRVPGSKTHWAMSITNEELEEMTRCLRQSSSYFNDHHVPDLKWEAPEIRLTFLLDKSESMGSTFANVALPACGQLYQSLKPTACNLVLFGRTVEVHPPNKITSAKFFELPEIKNTPLENATNIVGGFKKAVDIALRAQEDITREHGNNFFEENKIVLDDAKEAEAARRQKYEHLPEKPEVDLNLTQKEENKMKRQFERHPPKPNVLHIFVLMSDGEDTINSQDDIEKALLDTYNMFKGSGIQSLFKVVGIGKSSDTQLAMRMKLAAQTVKVWESTPVHYVRRAASLPVVMQSLADELKTMLSDRSRSLQLSAMQYVIGEGFVVNLTNPPVKDIAIRLHPTKRTCFMYKGVPPRSVMVNTGDFFGSVINVYLQEKASLDEVGVQASILELLSSLVSDIRVAIVAGRDVSKTVQEVREMVDGVKNANFDEHDLLGTSPAQRVQIMKNKRRLVVELEEILNALEDTINLGKSKMSSDQQAVWLNQAGNMRYGAQALRRATKTQVDCAAVVKSLQDIKYNVESEKLRELPTDPKSPISGLTAVGHLREINPPFPTSIVDLLYSYGITGIGIQVMRSEASNIDPWKISVTYISKDWWDTTSAMCGLHAMATHRDTMGRQVQDVLVILDPKNPEPYLAFLKSPLHAAYMGVIFARNPDIQLPAQRSGLLMSALVRGITQLLEPAFRTREFVGMLLKLVYTIRKRINAAEINEYWDAVLKKLTLSQPGKWMTEAPEDDIGSVAKLLGVMCCSMEKVKNLQLFDDTEASKQQLAEVSLALLAETSSRGARGKIKGIIEKERLKDLTAKPPLESKITHDLLFDALGLSENCSHPDPSLEVVDEPVGKHSNEWNLERAKKKSGNFFYNQVNTGSNNCPPQAVLACLTFAKAVATPQFEKFEQILTEGSDELIAHRCDHIINAFEGVSMKTFIQRYICFEGSNNLVGSTPVDLQVALYVQGAKYHNSQTRRQGLPSLTHAKEVVNGIAQDERAAQYEAELAAKFAQVRKLNWKAAAQAALAAKRLEQTIFMRAHEGMAKIFGFSEIALLNQSRPPNDQLERIDGGLLKHHCCFPSCPSFLKNFATEKDKVLGRRRGIYRHLKLFVHPANYYVPHIHLVADSIVKRDPRISLDAFMHKVDKDTSWTKVDYSMNRKNELIEQLYHMFVAFYNQKN